MFLGPGTTQAPITVSQISSAADTRYMEISGANVSQLWGMRNRIINGAMRIDQRNVGAAVTTASFSVDRFNLGGNTSSWSVQQVSDAPAGFIKSLKWTVTAAAVAGASNNAGILYCVEGSDMADFNYGTANAQQITLSFWAKSSVSGNHGLTFRNGSSNRSYCTFYTINATNTWEYKTITISGDTTGTWATDNTAGMYISWATYTGSTYSGAAGSWITGNYIGTNGTINLADTNGATLQITGVQLELGSQATPFERRLFAAELMLCQRYFRKTFPYATAPATSVGISGALRGNTVKAAAGSCTVNWIFNPPMRSTPTIQTFNPSANNTNWTDIDISSTYAVATNVTDMNAQFIVNGTSTAGDQVAIHATASAEM